MIIAAGAGPPHLSKYVIVECVYLIVLGKPLFLCVSMATWRIQHLIEQPKPKGDTDEKYVAYPLESSF